MAQIDGEIIINFSNDDLKRLKEHLTEPHAGADAFDFYHIDALLARLEAAELCARFLDAISESQRAPIENEALKAWRKSVGK